MHLSRKHILIYIMPWLIMAFIFVQSALPADLSSEESSFLVDWICRYIQADPEVVTVVVRKAAHFSEYLVLGISLGAAVSAGVAEKKNRKWNEGSGLILMQAGLIGVLYAVSDEIHQRFVPGRSGELRDILIDSVGVICGLMLLRMLLRKKAAEK